jgi:hypothetical protein
VKTSNKKIRISAIYLFRILTFRKCCHRSENLCVEKAIKRIKNELDVFEILSRLQEVEKLKNLLLDKNQIILFNFFPKPVISFLNNEED